MLEKAILDCEQQSKTNKLNVTSEDILKRFETASLTWKEAANAILYLGQRNDYRCFHEERLNLLYATSSLDYIMDEFEREKTFDIHGDTVSIKGMMKSTLLRFSGSYNAEIKYNRLPDEVRAYLEGNIVEQPFSYIPVIDKIMPASPK